MEPKVSLETSKFVYESLIQKYHYRVPIAVFNEVEDLIRPYIRSKQGRVFYRGPRRSNRTRNKPSMTMRCDAKFVDITGAR